MVGSVEDLPRLRRGMRLYLLPMNERSTFLVPTLPSAQCLVFCCSGWRCSAKMACCCNRAGDIQVQYVQYLLQIYIIVRMQCFLLAATYDSPGWACHSHSARCSSQSLCQPPCGLSTPCPGRDLGGVPTRGVSWETQQGST